MKRKSKNQICDVDVNELTQTHNLTGILICLWVDTDFVFSFIYRLYSTFYITTVCVCLSPSLKFIWSYHEKILKSCANNCMIRESVEQWTQSTANKYIEDCERTFSDLMIKWNPKKLRNQNEKRKKTRIFCIGLISMLFSIQLNREME